MWQYCCKTSTRDSRREKSFAWGHGEMSNRPTLSVWIDEFNLKFCHDLTICLSTWACFGNDFETVFFCAGNKRDLARKRKRKRKLQKRNERLRMQKLAKLQTRSQRRLPAKRRREMKVIRQKRQYHERGKSQQQRVSAANLRRLIQ